MTRTFAIAAGVAVCALLAGTAAYMIGAQRGDRFAQCYGEGTGRGTDAIGGPFTLTRHDGAEVTEAEVVEGLTLVYFGYTFCPDVCPFDVVRNAEAVELAEEDGAIVRPVFVTVDPERDTAEVMADYVGAMHPRMVGLTGTEDQVETAKKAYSVYAARAAGTGGADEHYLVDHTTLSYLMHPDEGSIAFFRREVSPEDMASRLSCFSEAI
ncbi:MAG: SCO family protein [Pseudomonadota bacterium]